MREHQPGNPLTSEEVISYVASRTDTVMLSFSAGKDSVAAWLNIRRHFKNIYPVYMYFVPELRIVEEGLKYYEEFFETRIIRVPQPGFYSMLATATHTPASYAAVLNDMEIPEFSRDDVFRLVALDYNLPQDTYVAMGVRAADSPNRRSTIMKYGAVNEKRLPPTFQPVWDWNKDRLIYELSKAGVHLTDDYRLFGRSFDGIDYRFLEPLKREYPDDYEKILSWFPFADADIARKQFHDQHKAKGWY